MSVSLFVASVVKDQNCALHAGQRWQHCAWHGVPAATLQDRKHFIKILGRSETSLWSSSFNTYRSQYVSWVFWFSASESRIFPYETMQCGGHSFVVSTVLNDKQSITSCHNLHLGCIRTPALNPSGTFNLLGLSFSSCKMDSCILHSYWVLREPANLPLRDSSIITCMLSHPYHRLLHTYRLNNLRTHTGILLIAIP